MQVAVLQTQPLSGQDDAVFNAISQALLAAKAMGADFLVTPELLFPGYNAPEAHAGRSQAMTGPWLHTCQDLVRSAQCGLILGWSEREGENVYNVATALAPNGEVLAHYRKIQLFGAMENASFHPGQSKPPVFDYNGTKYGLLICYDVEFYHHCADLADRGAEVVFVPTANPDNFDHVTQFLVPTRAYENGLTIIYANYCGEDMGLAFGGLSTICGPDGEIIAQAGRSPTLLCAKIRKKAEYPSAKVASLRQDLRCHI